ncbi:MAG: DUF5060 domain-containing protein [Acidobacteria bacterium]|nr:DUF5060 domain-containing protein [Acidobacteriota bacterium]
MKFLLLFLAPLLLPAQAAVTGENRIWHKITLTFTGPESSETAAENPFTDYRLDVAFTHRSGGRTYRVPGYFAADGNAAQTSSAAGNKWRVHFAPDRTGEWTYRASMVKGPRVAVEANANGTPVAGVDGVTGTLRIAATNKRAPDFRAKGRLQYVGEHFLRFAGNNEYFLKAGADSPETLLAYEDFDGTTTRKIPLKKYAPHLRDWRPGDPTWKDGKGKGLIGAVNYLAAKGMNVMSFLTFNTGGDGDNVWPHVSPDDKLRMDVSKLDQWQIVFDHAQAKGIYLHFKLQEQENDDNREVVGGGGTAGGPAVAVRNVPAAMDEGRLGPERKLYLRELIARFGYALALNWNMGEENTQSPEEQRDMAKFIKDTDPYQHHLVVHTFPQWQDRVYSKLTGEQSVLSGASLQMMWDQVHQRTLQWRRASAQAGRRWIVANDEQGSAQHGVPPDDGYQGFAGKDRQGRAIHNMHDIRKRTLWGNLMAGGAGVEYYFGYQLAENDLVAEDFRSRDKSWDYCRIALEFFREHRVPFWEMEPADALAGNTDEANGKFVLAKKGVLYLVYLPGGGVTQLDLSGAPGTFSVRWLNPRTGGPLMKGSVASVRGGGSVDLGAPPGPEDWLAVLRR